MSRIRWTWTPWRFYTALAVVFLTLLTVRGYFVYHKTAVHVDEALSYVLSSCGVLGWGALPEEGKAVRVDDLRKKVYYGGAGIEKVAYDIFWLHKTSRDSPHTNIYYSLLRLSSLGKEYGDIKQTLWHGGILNILLFICSFIGLYKISAILFENKSAQLCALLAAFFAPATISNTLFLRPYQLQETAFIFVTYIFLKHCLRIKNNDTTYLYSYKKIFIDALIIAVAMLSGYFGIFYVFMLIFYTMLYAIKAKMVEYIKYFIFISLLSIVFSFALYASAFVGLFVDHGAAAMQKASISYIYENFYYIVSTYTNIVTDNILSIFSLAIVLLFFAIKICRREKLFAISRPDVHIFIILLLWSIVIMFLSHYKLLRYIMPIVPLGILFLFSIAVSAHGRANTVVACLLTASILCMFFMKKDIDYYTSSYSFSDTSQPLAISTYRAVWLFPTVLAHVPDQRQVVFLNSCASLANAIKNRVFVEYVVDLSVYASCEELEREKLEFQFEFPGGLVYRLRENVTE